MKVSVCMASYNGAKYIKEQIDSILSQIGDDEEFIISDDHSTDTTIDIIKSINDKRIKLFANEQQSGYSKNFENAIIRATGDVIFISDQDDVWKEGKVKEMLFALQNADMVISDAEIVDEHLTSTYHSHFDLNGTRSGFWNNFLKTRYIGACMAFKKEVLKKALPFPNNSNLCAYDYWLAIVSEYYFKVVLLNKAMIKYRRHGSNASSGGVSSNNSLLKKVKIRIYAMQELLKRKNI
ncbi:glycosyltransferase [Mucilaginibacter glaciei]|uniref:Glycosyltransferase n=1 Tax=Mucilaginibacter glaciei TaxID=2772109 RepID=A0A926RZX7_9SPHI|nr:glycosyltransferase [Mucilaginibacter glaciei]MBD1392320.1 glycosyltransferase [Mucilaginibacter glaciei]